MDKWAGCSELCSGLTEGMVTTVNGAEKPSVYNNASSIPSLNSELGVNQRTHIPEWFNSTHSPAKGPPYPIFSEDTVLFLLKCRGVKENNQPSWTQTLPKELSAASSQHSW